MTIDNIIVITTDDIICIEDNKTIYNLDLPSEIVDKA